MASYFTKELTKKELLAVAKKHKAIRINNFLSSDDLDDYIEDNKDEKPFLIHEGDLNIEAQFVPIGAVLIIEGDLMVAGCISTFSNTFNSNYIFVTGNVYCQSLVTLSHSFFVIGGDLKVRDILHAYAMNMHLAVMGSLQAKYIIWGYTFLYINKKITCDIFSGSSHKNDIGNDIIVANYGEQPVPKSKSKKIIELLRNRKIKLNKIHTLNIFVEEVFKKDENTNELILNEDALAQYLLYNNNVLK